MREPWSSRGFSIDPVPTLASRGDQMAMVNALRVSHAFGANGADTLEAAAFCRANLAAFKAPRHVTFVAEFPRTPAGKIPKHLLEPVAKKPAARALHA